MHPENGADDDVGVHGGVLCDGQARGHTHGHRHLFPGLPPARGRHRDVLPRHLLPQKSGHPRVSQSKRDELVQVNILISHQHWLQ